MAGPFAFSPLDPETRRDPYALYARGRRERPVFVHEGLPLPWRDLQWALRRFEDRGLVRGGRFVAGFSG